MNTHQAAHARLGAVCALLLALLRLAHQLGGSPVSTYTAALHTDNNNLGESYILGLGEYTGGELYVRTLAPSLSASCSCCTCRAGRLPASPPCRCACAST